LRYIEILPISLSGALILTARRAWSPATSTTIAAERIFLRKVGGYVFIRRLLLAHFAKTVSVQKPVDGAGPNW
jgi:hypothetical protein